MGSGGLVFVLRLRFLALLAAEGRVHQYHVEKLRGLINRYRTTFFSEEELNAPPQQVLALGIAVGFAVEPGQMVAQPDVPAFAGERVGLALTVAVILKNRGIRSVMIGAKSQVITAR